MTDSRIAGALFDFLGFLTTRPEPLTVGASHGTPAALELLREWANERGLDLDKANVKGWQLGRVGCWCDGESGEDDE